MPVCGLCIVRPAKRFNPLSPPLRAPAGKGGRATKPKGVGKQVGMQWKQHELTYRARDGGGFSVAVVMITGVGKDGLCAAGLCTS